MSDTDQIRSRLVARKLSESIGRGEVAVGSYLPSTRALASQFGVSLGTVQVALRELQTQSLVECLPRRGTVVRQMPGGDTTRAAWGQVAVKPTLIGVVGPDLAHSAPISWGHTIIRSAGQRLFDRHFTLAQLPWFETPGDFQRIMLGHLDRLGDGLAGVLTWAVPGMDGMLAELDRRNIPWVSISRLNQEYRHNYVEADNVGSMRLMGKCCAHSGAHQVLYLTSSICEGFTALNKATGLYQGFLEAGVPANCIDVVTIGEVTRADGYQAVREYLQSGKRPDVVVAFGDLLGAGAEEALCEAGLEIPKQVGVIAGTGTDLSAEVKPSMTVVAQPMARMGQAAADMLMGMIRDGTRRLMGRRIPCELVFRESFAMPASLMEEVRSYNERATLERRDAATACQTSEVDPEEQGDLR